MPATTGLALKKAWPCRRHGPCSSPPISAIAARSIPSRCPSAPWRTSSAAAPTRLRQTFDRLHDRRYGHAAPDESIQVVNLRLILRAIGADTLLRLDVGSPICPTDLPGLTRLRDVDLR